MKTLTTLLTLFGLSAQAEPVVQNYTFDCAVLFKGTLVQYTKKINLQKDGLLINGKKDEYSAIGELLGSEKLRAVQCTGAKDEYNCGDEIFDTEKFYIGNPVASCEEQQLQNVQVGNKATSTCKYHEIVDVELDNGKTKKVELTTHLLAADRDQVARLVSYEEKIILPSGETKLTHSCKRVN